MSQFENDTYLYHADHGARVFAQGDEHPGDGWCDAPHDAGLRDASGVGDAPKWAASGAKPKEPETNDDPPAIPEDWVDMHWTQKVALAKALGHDITTQEEAIAAIEGEIAKVCS